jgi:hypothetical protein
MPVFKSQNLQVYQFGLHLGFPRFLLLGLLPDIPLSCLPSLLISDLFHPDSLQWRSPLISSLFEENSAKAIMELKILQILGLLIYGPLLLRGVLLQIQLILLSFIILCQFFLPSIISLERALEIKIK